jgi:hypothetical protein
MPALLTPAWRAAAVACSLALAPPPAEDEPLPDDAKAQAELARDLSKLLSRPFQIHLTSHFVVIHDTDESFARSRGGLLELTHRQFYKAFEKFEPPPDPVERRLVCVLFERFDDYARYAQEVDGESMAWAGGYYSSGTNRIAFFHDLDAPRFKEVAEKIDGIKAQIDDARRELHAARRARDSSAVQQARQNLEVLLKQQRWLHNRMGAVAAGGNDAKTSHEAVHQLSYNTGLQNPRVQYPFWLTEGLATCFEADGVSQSFGPYHDNLARRKLLIEAQRHGRLAPLQDFAVMTDLPEEHTHEQAVDLYSQAWGLFRFLFRYKQPALRQYMQDLAGGPIGPRNSQIMLDEFEAAFGPIAKVEREFNSRIRSWR